LGDELGGVLDDLLARLGGQGSLGQQALDQGGFGWTFALDLENRAAFRYLVLGLPAHFFIARDGTIQDSIIGEISPVDMEAQVARLLQK
jgi:hypothetical protein